MADEKTKVEILRTKFYRPPPVTANFGLFSGLKIKTESFEAILAGGIAFATPDFCFLNLGI